MSDIAILDHSDDTCSDVLFRYFSMPYLPADNIIPGQISSEQIIVSLFDPSHIRPSF